MSFYIKKKTMIYYVVLQYKTVIRKNVSINSSNEFIDKIWPNSIAFVRTEGIVN